MGTPRSEELPASMTAPSLAAVTSSSGSSRSSRCGFRGPGQTLVEVVADLLALEADVVDALDGLVIFSRLSTRPLSFSMRMPRSSSYCLLIFNGRPRRPADPALRPRPCRIVDRASGLCPGPGAADALPGLGGRSVLVFFDGSHASVPMSNSRSPAVVKQTACGAAHAVLTPGVSALLRG